MKNFTLAPKSWELVFGCTEAEGEILYYLMTTTKAMAGQFVLVSEIVLPMSMALEREYTDVQLALSRLTKAGVLPRPVASPDKGKVGELGHNLTAVRDHVQQFLGAPATKARLCEAGLTDNAASVLVVSLRQHLFS